MPAGESYQRLGLLALLLALALLGAFQVHLIREPARIQAALARDQSAAVAAGQELYARTCAACHGEQGEGGLGPALHTTELLEGIDDEGMFSLVSTGVPGTAMPSWSQRFGGPLTDEEVRQVVAYLRSWESEARAGRHPKYLGNPANGRALFGSTCFACHGPNGEGTVIAPALNDPAPLARFDDEWFQETISQGRPSKGMPTWGQVLSPRQIADIIAYMRSWTTAAAAAGDPLAQGAQLFRQVGCAACHGPSGEGTSIAPALPGHTAEQVRRQVRSSRGVMPAFPPDKLSDEDLEKITAFIESLGGTEAAHDLHMEPLDQPRLLALHHWMAIDALKADNVADALHHLGHLHDLTEGDHRLACEEAEALLRAGKLHEAEHAIEMMLGGQAEPDLGPADVHLELALEAVESDDAADARHHLEHFLTLASDEDAAQARGLLESLAAGDHHAVEDGLRDLRIRTR